MSKPRPWILWTVVFGLALLLVTAWIGLSGNFSIYSIITGLVTPAAAFFAAFANLRVWLIEKDAISKDMWAGLGLGFLSWALADSVWTFYDLVLQADIPYPSVADFFWAVGYVFFFIALGARLRKLPIGPNKVQLTAIIAISLFWVTMTTVFVLRPILAEIDHARLWEAILNIFFPVADTVIASMCTILLILLYLGRFSLSWRWIFAGMFLMTISDLFYSYATWQGLYFPDDQVNLISALIDVTYVAAYLVSGLGTFIYRDILLTKKTSTVNLVVKSASRYYAMIFTNRNHEIISASSNLPVLVGAHSLAEISGRSLSYVFHIAPDLIRQMFDRLGKETMLRNEPLTIFTNHDEQREVWITAVAAYDLNNQYNGANIAVRANLDVPEGQMIPAQKELQFDLRHLLNQAGLLAKDENQSMRIYFVNSIQVLSDLIVQFGGEPFQKSLLDEMRKVAAENELPVKIDGLSLTVQDDVENRQLAEILHLLLEVAEDFVSDIVGDKVVREELILMEQHIDPEVLKDVNTYRLSEKFISAGL